MYKDYYKLTIQELRLEIMLDYLLKAKNDYFIPKYCFLDVEKFDQEDISVRKYKCERFQIR